MIIKAVSCGDLVVQVLAENQKLNLHSEFQHGCNLSTPTGLIFLGESNQGQVPFGIQFTAADWQVIKRSLNPRPQITYHDQMITIGNLTIELSETKTLPGTIRPLTTGEKNLCKENLNKFSQHLEANLGQTGLAFENERAGTITWPTTATSGERFLRAYLGRGQGLTPAGDDFLIGILALNRGISFLKPEVWKSLPQLLTEGLTTSVAENYLQAANQGHFSQSVKEVIESLGSGNLTLFTKKINQLAKSGSTSGTDTLCGIYVGLLALRKEEI